ncbi:MAG TPA: hypothetical protein VN684_08830 [Terriglobales bacterium]|nr:hypothetical protein [Terriglobales bacterium]
MKYEKPLVVANGFALACVQITNKPARNMFDVDHNQTATAYEADE